MEGDSVDLETMAAFEAFSCAHIGVRTVNSLIPHVCTIQKKTDTQDCSQDLAGVAHRPALRPELKSPLQKPTSMADILDHAHPFLGDVPVRGRPSGVHSAAVAPRRETPDSPADAVRADAELLGAFRIQSGFLLLFRAWRLRQHVARGHTLLRKPLLHSHRLAREKAAERPQDPQVQETQGSATGEGGMWVPTAVCVLYTQHQTLGRRLAQNLETLAEHWTGFLGPWEPGEIEGLRAPWATRLHSDLMAVNNSFVSVLPGILQKHCCISPDRNTESQCTLCGEPEEEEGGDLVQPGISFPGPVEEDLDQQYSWPPAPHFNEERYSPAPRNMKGLSGSRNPPPLCSGHTCGLAPPEDCEHLHRGPGVRQPYLLSPADGCPLDRRRCSPRSSVHSECAVLPLVLADHVSSSTFPRMHCSSHYDARDDCAVAHASAKANRIPANLLDQFEKQLPLHRDGFHTLQYQRTSSANEPRGESPGRIRHLVHSVQKLFTKSHSLEGSSKGNINGARGDGRGEDHHGHHPKHSKRSKSKDRKPESKHRSGLSSWWSSDDNLDSDSTCRASSVVNRHLADHAPHCYPEPLPGPFGDLSLKTSKSNNDVKCSACEGLAMTPDAKYMKRSSWSTLTVSQAKEAYRKSSLNLDKPPAPPEIRPPLRPCHYLQVPQDAWAGCPVGGKDEIPCRRMRSGSYIKAMGDEDSGESDSSPKTSPTAALRPEPLLTSLAGLRTQSYLPAASDGPAGHSLDLAANYSSPKFRSRNQSYMRAVSTLSQASCVSQMSEAEVNGQFESVCESVFGEVESQAMDALDLPGCFRTRSHSYLRAIQAGYAQDDECVPALRPCAVPSTVRPPAAVSYTNYKKTPPPVPPRTTSKPLISVTAQSSTESTQDAYQDSRAQRASPWAQDGRGLYNSTDSLDSTKAMSLALEAAAAQRLAGDKAEDFLRGRCSSVGIQDSEFPERPPYPRSDVETATDSDTESRGLREYHSVGVQVEDEKRRGRFKRSNSVTAAVQADLELEGFPGHVPTEDKGLQFGSSFQRHSEPSTPTQYGAVRTVRTQGLFSYREDYRAPADTATLPAPEPWLEPAVDVGDGGRVSPCRRDGSWFLKLLHTETQRMEGWCKEMEREAEDNDLAEEILGKIRSAVGSAQLLMSQKFQQFYWLCQQNMDPSAMPRPTSQDLAGYWDMLQLSVEDVSMKFDELHQLKLNDWKVAESPDRKEERKVPPPIPKKPPKGKFPITREKSLDLPDRQRQEARRRLLAAKRAASFRQNSAGEHADSIEIYIPEAQTRL
ncbi:disks large-associated protein 2 [Pteronotus mesoamericanus]|uniref:disks large-associated protein 2 n=1 Tax=Pteronotus mesoamericanus TaxID=1884717 RepID=UPI0023ECA00B|nr:disks large-associated protein 2 [Pteronotus parnellii mesoamericanus]